MIQFIRKTSSLLQKYSRHKSKLIVLVFLVISITRIQAQDNIEFLSQDSFEELSRIYDESESEEMALSFAKAFLLKAKRENNNLKKAEGYYMVAENLTISLAYKEALPYLDSAIVFSKDNYTDIFPARAHILKANISGAQTNFKEATDQLTIANGYARKTNNVDQQYDIKYFISILKNNIGEYDEGFSLLKETLEYRKDKFLKDSTYRRPYLQSVFALASRFNSMKKPDSALINLKKAMAIALKTKDSILYSRMLLSTVHSLNLKSEYQSSLDSLKKYQAIANKIDMRIGTELRIALWYGNTYFKQGKKEIALPYLKKVDSIAFADSFFVESLKENYGFLITYYKEKKDAEQQLFYINRLLKMDSILDKDGVYLSKKLHKGYDTPNLIRQKQQLITDLEKEKSTRKMMLILLSIFSVGLIGLLIWNYKKQKTYKKRFYELLKQDQNARNKQNRQSISSTGNSDISEEVIREVIEKLEGFENAKGFLQINLSVGSMAKQFNTNSKYFSKIINTYKGKSFTNYINELRINYVVDEIKNNAKFRKYTVKAIANEIGFNTTEAFSKSFYKTTGIYPSYYIKQLEKQYVTL